LATIEIDEEGSPNGPNSYQPPVRVSVTAFGPACSGLDTAVADVGGAEGVVPEAPEELVVDPEHADRIVTTNATTNERLESVRVDCIIAHPFSPRQHEDCPCVAYA
jgi:hypothetical protein